MAFLYRQWTARIMNLTPHWLFCAWYLWMPMNCQYHSALSGWASSFSSLCCKDFFRKSDWAFSILLLTDIARLPATGGWIRMLHMSVGGMIQDLQPGMACPYLTPAISHLTSTQLPQSGMACPQLTSAKSHLTSTQLQFLFSCNHGLHTHCVEESLVYV